MARKVLTPTALAAYLRDRKGSEFVTIVSTTKPRVLKKDRETGEPNPFGQIVKVSRVNGLVGFRYENSVNNQRTREDHSEAGEFVAEPRTWGEHVNRADGGLSSLVEHKGRTYLEVKVERSLGTTYYDESGTERTYDEVRGVLPKRSESKRQDVENPVILRDYALDNLREISIGGDEIILG